VARDIFEGVSVFLGVRQFAGKEVVAQQSGLGQRKTRAQALRAQ
jgi:hypothetical protein